MRLHFQPIQERSDLLALPVKEFIEGWDDIHLQNTLTVAEIDPQYMSGIELCKQYNIPENSGANCVIVKGVRSDSEILAACLVPVHCKKTDLNNLVRKHLHVRRVSLAPLEEVLQKTHMEYGSITVIGLSPSWPILIDPRIISLERVVLGSGLQRSKLSLPGKALLKLPNVHILEGLCKEA